MDSRRFNFQKTNEVAVILKTNSEGEIPKSYVTIFNNCRKSLKIENNLDPNVKPWTYSIFYLYGSNDRGTRMKKKIRSRLLEILQCTKR